MALSLTDRDDLALAVDIRHLQIDELGNPQPGAIDGHQDGAVFEVRRDLEECCYFGRAQDQRKLLLLPMVRNMFNHPVSVQDIVVEKTQRTYGFVEHRPRELFLLNQEQLILTDMFRSEPIWLDFKMFGKVGHATDVSALGMG